MTQEKTDFMVRSALKNFPSPRSAVGASNHFSLASLAVHRSAIRRAGLDRLVSRNGS